MNCAPAYALSYINPSVRSAQVERTALNTQLHNFASDNNFQADTQLRRNEKTSNFSAFITQSSYGGLCPPYDSSPP
jgi:hypothetical protein